MSGGVCLGTFETSRETRRQLDTVVWAAEGTLGVICPRMTTSPAGWIFRSFDSGHCHCCRFVLFGQAWRLVLVLVVSAPNTPTPSPAPTGSLLLSLAVRGETRQ